MKNEIERNRRSNKKEMSVYDVCLPILFFLALWLASRLPVVDYYDGLNTTSLGYTYDLRV